MIASLLDTAANTGEQGNFFTSNWPMLVILLVLIVAVVVFYVLGSKKRKKQEKDAQDLINSVKPGNKVKTIGGVCGIVVEVDNEENTFVLETGTETSGKSYIKFDRQAIYQTDAVLEKDAPKAEEPVEELTAETPVTETAEASETSAETTESETTENAPAMTKSKKNGK